MRAQWRSAAVAAGVVAGCLAVAGPAQAAPTCGPARVAVQDVQDYEGTGSGSQWFAFTVTATATAPGCGVSGSVNYRATSGTAVAGADFAAVTGMLQWTSGTPGPRVVVVPVTRDQAPEPDEAFTVELTAPRGVTITDGTAAGVVLDDDGQVTVPVEMVLLGGGICWDPTGLCKVGLSLSTPARAAVSVRVSTVDGTAFAGKDYLPLKDFLVTFPVGASTAEAEVVLNPADGHEADEYFGVVLTGAGAGTIAVPRETVTIAGD